MHVKIIPIVKALRNNAVFILLENGRLPEIDVGPNTQPIDQLSVALMEEYKIKPSWIEIYYVGMYMHEETLRIYYSSFVPDDFLVSHVSKKMSCDYGGLPIYDREQIRQALSISPY